MDFSTTYLGLPLRNPLIAGASPLTGRLDSVRALEDAGAAAIVLPSLFEEQIDAEAIAVTRAEDAHLDSFGEAISYLPDPEEFRIGPEDYLEHLRAARAAVDIPVIASLNGTTRGGWLAFARELEQAGAHALELNVYYVATDPDESGERIEAHICDMLREVRAAIGIPIAVKLSPFYTSFAHLALRLKEAGATGLVLFNRFFEPDIDTEDLETLAHLRLSDPSELLLRLRWLAILSGTVDVSLAVTGGVHSAIDAVKSLMCGAHAIQLVSVLLRRGPAALGALLEETARWLEEHEYGSAAELIGCMNLTRCPDPKAFERGNYMHILHTWEQAAGRLIR